MKDDTLFYRNPNSKYIATEEDYQGMFDDIHNAFGDEMTVAQKKSIDLICHVLGLRKINNEDLERWRKLNVINSEDNFYDETFHDFNDDGQVRITVGLLMCMWDGLIYNKMNEDGEVTYLPTELGLKVNMEIEK